MLGFKYRSPVGRVISPVAVLLQAKAEPLPKLSP